MTERELVVVKDAVTTIARTRAELRRLAERHAAVADAVRQLESAGAKLRDLVPPWC